jgi:hypothetical protein
MVRPTTELQTLHEEVMRAAQGFVDRPKNYVIHQSLSAAQEALLKEHGNPYSFQFYTPHITVGSLLSRADTERLRAALHKSSFTSKSRVDSIVVVDKQNDGIYRTIPFKLE